MFWETPNIFGNFSKQVHLPCITRFHHAQCTLQPYGQFHSEKIPPKIWGRVFSNSKSESCLRFYLGQASELVCHYLHYCIQEWPFLTWGLLHCVQIQSSGENCTCSPEDASHYKMKDQQQTIAEWKPPCRSLYQTCVSEQHCINLFNRIKYGCFQNLQPLKLYPLLWNVNTTEWSCNDEITSFAFPTARAWSWYSFNWAQCQSWSIIRKALD